MSQNKCIATVLKCFILHERLPSDCWQHPYFFLMNLANNVCKTITLSFSVVSQVQLPANITVLKGSDAQINAIVLSQWNSMTWSVDSTLVLIFNPLENSTITQDRYTASLCATGNMTCVQFIIRNVTRNDMVVECDVLGLVGSQTELYVQGKARDNFFTVVRWGWHVCPNGDTVCFCAFQDDSNKQET